MEIKKLIEKYEDENRRIMNRRPDLTIQGDFTSDGIKLFCNVGFIDDLKSVGKADSTSEKDLRVCEVIASASFIVQKGVDAMYDELIDKHLNILRQQPFTSSVQHFVETGKVSGTFLLQLRKLLKEHDEICQAAK